MKSQLAKLAFLSSVIGVGAISAPAMATCYTVYGAGNQVVYNAETPPVDMSLPLHQTLPAVYPGGHMVFGEGGECPRVNTAGTNLPLPNRRAASPLLTDRKTAEAMNAPHVMLSGNVALVDQRNAGNAVLPMPALEPAVEVAAAQATRNMGASRAATGGTVITEMRNPPMTVVQSAAGVIVTGQ